MQIAVNLKYLNMTITPARIGSFGTSFATDLTLLSVRRNPLSGFSGDREYDFCERVANNTTSMTSWRNHARRGRHALVAKKCRIQISKSLESPTEELIRFKQVTFVRNLFSWSGYYFRPSPLGKFVGVLILIGMMSFELSRNSTDSFRTAKYSCTFERKN